MGKQINSRDGAIHDLNEVNKYPMPEINTDKNSNKFNSPEANLDKDTGHLAINIPLEMGSQYGDSQYGTWDQNIIKELMNQVTNTAVIGSNTNVSDVNTRLNASMASVVELEPKDTLELMLASQMVAVHNMAMEMSKRAMIDDQTIEGVDRNINRVTKLMRTFTAQIEALNKYRSKGQQKITVQYVNVEDGGQAIVGDVKGGG